jgi:hypothetical protein
VRRQRRHDLFSHDRGWTPLDEEKGSAFGQALRDAVKAATPKMSARNVYRLVEGQAVSIHQGHRQAAEACETVEILPSGTHVTDKRRVR